MPTRLNDTQHWRDRATEMRALAATHSDVEAARIMCRLADDYDKLAERADVRAASGLSRLPSAMPKEP
jgi:hypothetical protein